jgi:glutaredoxin-like protein
MNTEIIFYGTPWCPDCHRSRRFLKKNKIPYTYVNIDRDPAGNAIVLEVNDGERIVPTIRFADGSVLVEPTNSELGEKLNL